MKIFANLKAEINESLNNLFSELRKQNKLSPQEKILIDSMQYGATLGGKRFRPILGVICAEACQAKIKREILIKTLLSIELIHAYSLIHDDLPEMDNDTIRRGKTTVWHKFTPATALLAGDSLQALAFENLSKNSPEFCLRKLTTILSQNSGWNGLCGGQIRDIFPQKYEAEVLKTHNKKTGKLILTAAEFGTTLARASFEQTNDILKFTDNLGLAFQIRDDLQDNDGIVKVWGNTKSQNFIEELGQECFTIANKFQSKDLHAITDFVVNH